MKYRRSRIGFGIVLIFAAIANVAGLREDPPVGGVETVMYYVLTFTLFAGGLWLIFRRRTKGTEVK